MRPRLRLAIITAIILTGLVIWFVGNQMPVYTDMGAPWRISNELQDLPREVRFKEWHLKLSTYETPHKRLSDLGRGLIAFGVGSLLAWGIQVIYRRQQGTFRVLFFVIAWLGLWAIRIPLTTWYYVVRQKRFDYPVWGDSIGIGIGMEVATWIIGALISSLVILILMFRRRLPSSLKISLPSDLLSRIRFGLISLWILILGLQIIGAVWDGDEGAVIACRAAIPLLLAVLVAKGREPKPKEALTTS